MGAIKDDNNVIFLNVSLGKIRRRLKEATEQSVSRVNKNQETIHELVYDGWAGRIDGVENRKTDYGTEIQLIMNDGEQVAKIGFMYTSDIFLDFANRLLSFSPEEIATKQVQIRPFAAENKKEGKTYTNNYLLAQLAGEDGTRPRKYTKESPGDMPQWEQVDNPNGEGKIWSSKKQRQFLAGKVAELIAKAQEIREKSAPTTPPPPPPAAHDEPDYEQPEETVVEDDDEDDPLPF